MTLFLVAGPQKIWTVTLKSAKQIFYKTFLKLATGGGGEFFDFLKAKNEEIFKKKHFLGPCTEQKQFVEKKNIKHIF